MSELKPTVYIETTIPSYLTARPKKNVVFEARRELTVQWWASRDQFHLLTSPVVLLECQQGDEIASVLRLNCLQSIEILPAIDEVTQLADALMLHVGLPAKAQLDAQHIAFSAVHHVRYLLTWNCRHLANAVFRQRIDAVCLDYGYNTVVICTPEELMLTEGDST